MSKRFDRLGWAMDQDDLTAAQKVVLIVLADAASEAEGLCWLKYATIAQRTSLGLSTVRRAVDDLIDLELLHKWVRYDKRGRQTSNYYQLGCYESEAEGAQSGHPLGARSEQGEVPAASTSIVNQPEATGSQPNRKKTSSPSSARTRSARSSHDDGPDKSTLADINDELRPGTRPLANTRRVSTGTRKPRKSPAEHIHAPRRRNAGGLACYWGEALEKVGSLEKSEEAIVGKFFKEWLGRGADLDMLRAMIDVFFADPELCGSSHRWKRFVSNAETIRSRVLHNYGVVVPGVDEDTEFGFDVPDTHAWLEELGASA